MSIVIENKGVIRSRSILWFCASGKKEEEIGDTLIVLLCETSFTNNKRKIDWPTIFTEFTISHEPPLKCVKCKTWATCAT